MAQAAPIVPGSLSIELLHLHPWKLRADVAAQAARIAARNVAALVNERSCRGQPTSFVVMLDDYFLTGKRSRIERILDETTGVLTEAAACAGLPIDLVVRESAMATLASQAVDLVADGVVDGVLHARAPYRRFSVDAVPLYHDSSSAEPMWSCPFLAAVWQLVRLGLLELDDDLVTVVGRDVPLAAERTLTLLSSRYLATEAAVQAVCTGLPDAMAEEVASRAAHLFVPDVEEPGTAEDSSVVRWLDGTELNDALDWVDAAVGPRPAAVLGDHGPLGVIDGPGLGRPYAAWETVVSGPETLTVARRVAARGEDVTEGLRCLTRHARSEGFTGVVYCTGDDDLAPASAAGFVPAVQATTWALTLWVDTGESGVWGHRERGVPGGRWLTPVNPGAADASGFVLLRPGLELADEISRLDATQYLVGLTAGEVAQMLSNWPSVVALRDGRVIGSALTRSVPGSNGRLGELHTVVVDPHMRGQGVGAAILTALESEAWLFGWDALYLESSQSYQRRWAGSPAPLYERLGWVVVAETPNTVYMAKSRPGSGVAVTGRVSG